MAAENRASDAQLCLTRPPDHVEWIEGDQLAWSRHIPPIAVGRRPPWRVCDARLAALSSRLRHGSAKESKMLVLSRKKNESIIINDDITIVVVEIRGDKVRLGVEAPKEVPVHRNEVYEAIRRNQGQNNAPAGEPDATSAAE